ncbi:hypothetical protein [Paenibacillus sp. y28]|uniref:hypothetical protein n=1 Tax=Paenibacillus sp. y28 TaxID=3129110 RepID=UPI003019D230
MDATLIRSVSNSFSSASFSVQRLLVSCTSMVNVGVFVSVVQQAIGAVPQLQTQTQSEAPDAAEANVSGYKLAFEQLAAMKDQLMGQVKEAYDYYAVGIKMTLNQMRDLAVRTGDVLKGVAVKAGTEIGEAYSKMRDKAIEMAPQVVKAYQYLNTKSQEILGRLGDRITKVGSRIGAIYDSFANATSRTLNNLMVRVDKVKSVFSPFVLIIQEFTNSMKGAFKRVASGIAAWSSNNSLLPGKEALSRAWEFGKKTIESAGQQELVKDRLIARTGSEETGTAIFDKFKNQAMTEGKDVTETLSGVETFLPMTSSTDQISKLLKISDQLAVFDSSGKGTKGAYDAVKAALSGDVGALTSKFNIKNPAETAKIQSAAKSGDTDAVISAMSQLLERQNMGEAAVKQVDESPLKKLETLQTNFTNAMNNVGIGALEALVPVMDKMNEAFQSGKLQPFFDLIRNGFTVGAQAMGVLVNTALWLFNVIQSNWPMVQAIFLALAAVFIPILISQVYSLAAAWLVGIAPILLVVAVIALLIYILMQCGVTAEQIVGTIIGIFYMLYAQIYNQIALIWNIFASLAEFLINLFNDPVYAVQKLFYDLAMIFMTNMYNMMRSAEEFAGGFMKTVNAGINGVIKGINWLTKAMNQILGTNMKEFSLLDEQNIHAVSDGIKGIMDRMTEPVSTENVVKVDRLDPMNPKAAFDSGYSVGAGIMNSLSGMSNMLTPDTGNIQFNKLNNNQAGAAAAGSTQAPNINHVNTVGSIDDKVNVDSEDIKIMRDLAEEKNIQNFVALTPTVQVTTGDIRSGEDVDTIIRRIEMHLEQQFVATAEGVYA